MNESRACAAWLKANRIHLVLTIVKALGASDAAKYIPGPARLVIAHQNLTSLILRLENNKFEAAQFEAEFEAAFKRGATLNNVAYTANVIVDSLLKAVETDAKLSPELREILTAKLRYYDTLLNAALAHAFVSRQVPKI